MTLSGGIGLGDGNDWTIDSLISPPLRLTMEAGPKQPSVIRKPSKYSRRGQPCSDHSPNILPPVVQPVGIPTPSRSLISAHSPAPILKGLGTPPPFRWATCSGVSTIQPTVSPFSRAATQSFAACQKTVVC